VRAVAPVAREADRTALLRYFDVQVRLDGTDPARMRPGMSVQVEVAGDTAVGEGDAVAGEPAAGALLAPRRALDLAGPTPRARLADGGWSDVTLGPCDAHRCVVTSGLAEGTRLAPAPATLARTSEPPPVAPEGAAGTEAAAAGAVAPATGVAAPASVAPGAAR
jgi:hypothetical protein